MNKKQIIAIVLLVALGFFTFGTSLLKSCTKNNEANNNTDSVEPENTTNLKPTPVFVGDSAFAFIAKQVAFGPRIPGSKTHKACGDWIIAQLKSYGAQVTTQPFVATAYDGVKRNSFNIIATINPSATKRILIGAHWDTRPIADQDPIDKNKPIDGAIDGASGVAVALEMARVMKTQPLNSNLGIDIILFDNEDNGTPQSYTGAADHPYGFYCLGSEYWAANKHTPNYSAYFGILLDMVGAKNTFFQKEGHSVKYANSITELVWNTAAQLGYQNFFKNEIGSYTTDDHVPVNEVAKIPMIDIISTNGSGFGEHWHTHKDNLSQVSKEHLKAVGQTVLQVIYNEQ